VFISLVAIAFMSFVRRSEEEVGVGGGEIVGRGVRILND